MLCNLFTGIFVCMVSRSDAKFVLEYSVLEYLCLLWVAVYAHAVHLQAPWLLQRNELSKLRKFLHFGEIPAVRIFVDFFYFVIPVAGSYFIVHCEMYEMNEAPTAENEYIQLYHRLHLENWEDAYLSIGLESKCALKLFKQHW